MERRTVSILERTVPQSGVTGKKQRKRREVSSDDPLLTIT